MMIGGLNQFRVPPKVDVPVKVAPPVATAPVKVAPPVATAPVKEPVAPPKQVINPKLAQDVLDADPDSELGMALSAKKGGHALNAKKGKGSKKGMKDETKAALGAAGLTAAGTVAATLAELLDEDPEAAEGKSAMPSGNVKGIGKSSPTNVSMTTGKPNLSSGRGPSMALEMLKKKG